MPGLTHVDDNAGEIVTGFGSWLAKEARITMKANLRSLKHGGSVDGVMQERKRARAEERVAGEEARARALGRVTLRKTRQIDPPTWAKYKSSTSEGRPQTDYYEGLYGETNKQKKVHIAIRDDGKLLYVRDLDGTVLFDHSKGDREPSDWDFS